MSEVRVEPEGEADRTVWCVIFVGGDRDVLDQVFVTREAAEARAQKLRTARVEARELLS